jgi:hypothetical protein
MATDRKIKYIRDFQLPESIAYGSGQFKFKIIGDNGAKFRLQVKNVDNHVYNWESRTFSATELNKSLVRTIKGANYTDTFVFPEAGKVNGYVFDLFALEDDCSLTKHVSYVEVRDEAGAVDTNKSVGSNSNLLTRAVTQGSPVAVNMSSIAPTLADGGEVWNGATHSSQALGSSLSSRRSAKKNNFKITVTAPSGKAIKIDRQPLVSDIAVKMNAIVNAWSSDYLLPDENIWSGAARGTDTTNAVMSGTDLVTMTTNVADTMAPGDRITGTGISASDVVTVLNVVDGTAKQFRASQNVSIGSGVTLTITEPVYYRWPVANHVRLTEGAVLDPNHAKVTANSHIAPYQTYLTRFYLDESNCEVNESTITTVDKGFEPIKPVGNILTSSYNRALTQAGEIIFNNPQVKSFESTSHKFYMYGERNIARFMYAKNVKITNLKAEIETANIVTTTISDASATGSAALSDFDVASVNGIMDDVSVVSGPNISVATSQPIVTTISTSNLTLTPGSHYVQNGQTLTFSGAASVITITGSVEIDDIGDNNTTLYFDVEKFLTCA